MKQRRGNSRGRRSGRSWPWILGGAVVVALAAVLWIWQAGPAGSRHMVDLTAAQAEEWVRDKDLAFIFFFDKG